MSWQTTVVGDPLYRPFGEPRQQLPQEMERRHSKFAEWSHLRIVNLNLARKLPVAGLVVYLEQTPATKHSAVLTEKLADLYAAQGKPCLGGVDVSNRRSNAALPRNNAFASGSR